MSGASLGLTVDTLRLITDTRIVQECRLRLLVLRDVTGLETLVVFPFLVVWRQHHFLSVHDKLGFKERLATSWLTKCFITLVFP